MAELTLGRLHNAARNVDEELSIGRNLAAADLNAGKGITSLKGGITDGAGNFGVFGDFLGMGGNAVEEDRVPKACLLAIDASVRDQSGHVGDLWMFVIEASDGTKIAVSGWAY